MRVVATGLKRPRWKKGEKEQMYALRQQKSDMPIKEFTEVIHDIPEHMIFHHAFRDCELIIGRNITQTALPKP